MLSSSARLSVSIVKVGSGNLDSSFPDAIRTFMRFRHMRPTTNTCSIISLAAWPHERETATGGSQIKSITIG